MFGKKFQATLFVSMSLLFSGCSFFIDKFVDKSFDVVDMDGKNLGLVFSHNVNGETHPCGCRHFPLGGLPQVAGALHKLEQTEKVVYIDSGDTLFASATIPQTLAKSQEFNARQLAEGLAKVGLKYWVPGDQDFAMGPEFIKELAVKNKINLILTNLNDEKSFPHKEYVLFEDGPHRIYLMGVINPTVLPSKYSGLFKDPNLAIKEYLPKLQQKGYDAKDPFHRLVIVSHSGIGLDRQIAKEFPNIDWIVGAHTMNFLRFPEEEGNAKIVQVLSRNHYMGHISFSFKGDKTKDKYDILEIRDEMKDELKPNPFLSFIDRHKEALSKIQKDEQSEMVESNLGVLRYATNNSCVECHDAQNKFWQGTAHSVAYYTLVSANKETDLSCVKCHSLGLNEAKGFKKVQDILEFDSAFHENLDGPAKTTLTEKYWKELKESFGPVKSVRELSSVERVKLAEKWEKHDSEFHVTRNFANVQCLNCHDQHDNHPFEDFDPPQARDRKIANMKGKCIECHDPDQSPEWYQKQSNGLSGALDQGVLDQKFKMMSCPQAKQ